MEERLKPPIMRFTEKLNLTSGVDQTLVEETIREVEDPSRIVSIMKNRANSLDQMTRSQLVGFIQTVMNLRDCFLEEQITAGSEVMQVRNSKVLLLYDNTCNVKGMASSVLKHLGRPTINWDELCDWEAKVLRQIIRDVEGVPNFVVRMVDQILTKTIRDSEANRNGQQMEMN